LSDDDDMFAADNEFNVLSCRCHRFIIGHFFAPVFKMSSPDHWVPFDDLSHSFLSLRIALPPNEC